ncbi:MAG: calcium/sodium antiporter [Atopobiaceae bacterium]|nr:calcium/sodium antiporter [Atopobiaceae bacterium]
MNGILNFAGIVAGLALLAKGADTFVDGASALASKLGIPSLVVGLTVVALGTSAPEAAISIASAAQQAGSMTIANVFGSNIVNMLVILGVVALVAKVPVRRATIRVDMPLVIGATVLLLALCLWDGVLGRLDALALLALLGGYIFYLIQSARNSEEAPERDTTDDIPTARNLVLCVLGAAAICLGANLTVDNALVVAEAWGVPQRVVGLTVIALGTSLPELVTSLTAARKGQTDIALGNVVGSGILNVLFVLGVSGAVSPIPFATELLFDGAVALASAALVWALCFRNKTLGRASGATMLAGYATYMGCLLA